MASRILGMGDMLTLIEKAQEDYDEQKAQELEKRLRKNQFTLEDFLEQMGQIRKMGGIGKLLGMMPGMNSRAMQNVNVEQSERDFVQMEAIIQSMTREERENPSILNASRRKRIAAGSGQPVSKINQLVKRYDETRKMMKSFTGKGGAGRMNRMFPRHVSKIEQVRCRTFLYNNYNEYILGGNKEMVKIRLKRMGANKKPFYRVVVADSRAPRDGKFIEEIGYYNPMTDPADIKIDEEKAQKWLGTGAQPTDTVKKLFQKSGIL